MRRTNRIALPLLAVLLIGLLIGLLAGCSATTAPQRRSVPPAPASASAAPAPSAQAADWAVTTPRDAGFDPRALKRIAADAKRNNANCLVVVRHGRLAAEWYWNGTTAATSQEVFSVTKSYTSTLVGMAQADGKLAIGDKAAKYIPRWRGTPAGEVTVRDLLSNDSGRHWDAGTDYRGLLRAQDRTGFAVGLKQDAAPGTVWVYNNAAIQTLDAVLRKALGQDPADYAKTRLFGPLGMTHTSITRDGAGNTHMFFGLHSTCRDLARFGQLFLRHGDWNGSGIVPREWVEEATGRPSQKLNAAYGYLWWLNRRGPVNADPMRSVTAGQAPVRRLVPDAPESMYWAVGLGGQVIQVDPGSDTVVVRLGTGDLQARYGPADTARVVTEALT